MVFILIPIDESFLAVEERDPDGIGLLLRAQDARHLEHESGRGSTIFGAHEILHGAQSIVVGHEQNDSGSFTGRFRDDVFHCHIADGRLRVEIVFVHLAAETLQLRLDVLLRSMNAIRCRWARTDRNKLRDVIEGFIAVESASFSGRRSWLGIECLDVEGRFRAILRRFAALLLCIGTTDFMPARDCE